MDMVTDMVTDMVMATDMATAMETAIEGKEMKEAIMKINLCFKLFTDKSLKGITIVDVELFHR